MTRDFKELIPSLCGLMSVSGWETYSRDKLLELVGDEFDESYVDNVENQIFVKKCGRENAPRILIDTHMDEIGMYVTEILEGGFLRIINVGGIDTRILQAAEVTVYGKKEIYGVIASTPPHIQKPGESKNLKEIGELLVDTGYSKSELEELIRIGTPIGFRAKYTELLGGAIAGKAIDDKGCAACALHAVVGCDREKLAGDVYLMLSAHEETVRVGGAAVGAYGVNPDYAMVVDVNHGKAPGVESVDSIICGGGPGFTLSAVTSRRLTRMTAELADEAEIKYQYSVSPAHTGTNTPVVNLTRDGIPVVDVGLPLKSMHTCNEVVYIKDCEETSKLIAEFICSKKIAEVFVND